MSRLLNNMKLFLKKGFVLFIVFVILILFCACSNKSEDDFEEKNQNTEPIESSSEINENSQINQDGKWKNGKDYFELEED